MACQHPQCKLVRDLISHFEDEVALLEKMEGDLRRGTLPGHIVLLVIAHRKADSRLRQLEEMVDALEQERQIVN